jgi:hypothetical protein
MKLKLVISARMYEMYVVYVISAIVRACYDGEP